MNYYRDCPIDFWHCEKCEHRLWRKDHNSHFCNYNNEANDILKRAFCSVGCKHFDEDALCDPCTGFEKAE
jgi:hypothetical protein